MSDEKIYDSMEDYFKSHFSKPNTFEKIYNWSIRLGRQIKDFGKDIFEYFYYGFTLDQAYDFAYWNAKVSVKRLKVLRDHGISTPAELTEDQWHDILDKIIWAFDNLENEPEYTFSEDYDRRVIVKQENGYTTISRANPVGKIDKTLVEEHYKKVQEGLDLFAKYYLNLWD